jgi:hypothetical protein
MRGLVHQNSDAALHYLSSDLRRALLTKGGARRIAANIAKLP